MENRTSELRSQALELAEANIRLSELDRLKSGGRLVINAVTVETTAEVFALQARLGGELTQIAISRLDRIGGFHALRPALPVVQWTWVKS